MSSIVAGTTLEEWTSVYDGLTEEQIEEQIEEIDRHDQSACQSQSKM